jgi:glycosyltransferase involved in cell wall biosynthesis
MLRGLDALFLACENAKLYIQQRFPQDVPDCEVWHLGVPQPSRINHASSDAVFRLVSCSYLVPVKRVELLLEAVAEVGRLHPEQQIDWKHFGGGPEEERLRSLASRVPANVSCHWYGSVPNDEIRRHYENHPVDLFATVTASEGGVPVSIMEAQSFGIPVLATDVGGIRDIITRENGILVDGAHGPVEIADALAWFISGRQNAGAMRDASRRICREDFDSQKNFQRFAVRLRSMIR